MKLRWTILSVAVRRQCAPPVFDLGKNPCRKVNPARRLHRGESVEEPLGRQVQDDEIRLRMVELGVEIEDLLVDLVEVGFEDLKSDAFLIAVGAYRLCQKLCCGVTQHCQAANRQGGKILVEVPFKFLEGLARVQLPVPGDTWKSQLSRLPILEEFDQSEIRYVIERYPAILEKYCRLGFAYLHHMSKSVQLREARRNVSDFVAQVIHALPQLLGQTAYRAGRLCRGNDLDIRLAWMRCPMQTNILQRILYWSRYRVSQAEQYSTRRFGVTERSPKW